MKKKKNKKAAGTVEVVAVRVCGRVDCKREATTKIFIKSASGHNDSSGHFCAAHAKARRAEK